MIFQACAVCCMIERLRTSIAKPKGGEMTKRGHGYLPSHDQPHQPCLLPDHHPRRATSTPSSPHLSNTHCHCHGRAHALGTFLQSSWRGYCARILFSPPTRRYQQQRPDASQHSTSAHDNLFPPPPCFFQRISCTSLASLLAFG
jgi:hypothetical protein